MAVVAYAFGFSFGLGSGLESGRWDVGCGGVEGRRGGGTRKNEE